MSNRALASTIRGAVLVATWALCASAQASDRLAVMGKSVAIARARADTVRAIVAIDSIRLAHLPTFRTYAGMDFHADSSQLPHGFIAALDSAAVFAQRDARAVIGPAADSMLRGVYMTVTVDSISPVDARADLVGLHARGNVHPRYSSLNARHPDVAELTALFISWFEDAAGHRLPPTITRWSQQAFSIGVQRPWVYASAYRDLVLEHPDLWRSCVGGSRAACRTALAIVPGNDTISAWYTVAQQREYVAGRYKHRSFWTPTYPMAVACIERHADTACHRFLEHFPPDNVSPTSAWSRRGLLRRAVIRGGAGAFERLSNATASDVAPVLELTAGVSVDSLVDEWRADVIAARPMPPTPSRAEVVSSVLLGLFAIGLAARRRP